MDLTPPGSTPLYPNPVEIPHTTPPGPQDSPNPLDPYTHTLDLPHPLYLQAPRLPPHPLDLTPPLSHIH